jgi:hypothetical protein
VVSLELLVLMLAVDLRSQKQASKQLVLMIILVNFPIMVKREHFAQMRQHITKQLKC